jgi:hypothetical protein
MCRIDLCEDLHPALFASQCKQRTGWSCAYSSILVSIPANAVFRTPKYLKIRRHPPKVFISRPWRMTTPRGERPHGLTSKNGGSEPYLAPLGDLAFPDMRLQVWFLAAGLRQRDQSPAPSSHRSVPILACSYRLSVRHNWQDTARG